ncbi:MAG TPA: hypothetical protein VI408_05415 [Gaiellaceae bacterium]
MSWLQRLLRAFGLRRKTAEEIAVDNAARRQFSDEKAGVVDYRKNR